MLKAIHAQESKDAAREKALQVSEKLRSMNLAKAAKKVEDGIEETLTYMDFPTQHWTRLRTNNAIERLNREIKRRTKAIGAFPDGQTLDARMCQTASCSRNPMGNQALYEYGSSFQTRR